MGLSYHKKKSQAAAFCHFAVVSVRGRSAGELFGYYLEPSPLEYTDYTVRGDTALICTPSHVYNSGHHCTPFVESTWVNDVKVTSWKGIHKEIHYSQHPPSRAFHIPLPCGPTLLVPGRQSSLGPEPGRSAFRKVRLQVAQGISNPKRNVPLTSNSLGWHGSFWRGWRS